MSVPSNREHHYRNLRDRYTNCTYVDGNLELTWLQDENLDLSFLQHIREVTGYVLISHVDVKRIILPSLQIIRGRTLFKLTVQEDEFALIVTLSKMHNLEMPALRGKKLVSCIKYYEITPSQLRHNEVTALEFFIEKSLNLFCLGDSRHFITGRHYHSDSVAEL